MINKILTVTITSLVGLTGRVLETNKLNASTDDFFYYSLKDDINLAGKELSNKTISTANNWHEYSFNFLIDNVSWFQTKDKQFYLYTNLTFWGRDIDFQESYVEITDQFDIPYIVYSYDENFGVNTSNDLIIADDAINLLDGITADFVFIKYQFYYTGSKLPSLAYRDFYITNNVRYLFGYIEDIPYNDYAESVGYSKGYDKGYDKGVKIGYDDGFNDGYLSTESGGVWSSLFNAVLAPFKLLEIEIFPNVSLGTIALIPIIFGLIAFIFKLGGKGNG